MKKFIVGVYLVWLSVVVGTVWVACHFIAKYW